jgi:hypothetical protein
VANNDKDNRREPTTVILALDVRTWAYVVLILGLAVAAVFQIMEVVNAGGT